MAITGNAYTAANLAATIPEIWSDIINEVNFPHAVLTNFCMDLSRYVEAGGDIVHVPDLYTQSTEGTEITPSVAAQVDDSLTVTTHSYVSWMLGDNTLSQVARFYDLNEAYARQAQGLLMNTVEAAIAALWSSLSTTAVGDTSAAVSDADIRVAISTLESADFRVEEMAFFFHPEVYWTQIHGISKYYTFETSQFPLQTTGNLPNQAGMQHAYKGQLFGIPLYTTTNVVNALQTYRNLLLTPRAFMWAIRPFGGVLKGELGPSPIKFRVQAEYQIRNLALLSVVDMSYGVAAIRADGGVTLNASNSFITS
jgi:hypothetical protein